MILTSCRTPKLVDQTQVLTQLEKTSMERETNQVDDTMTIRHTIINDTSLVTTIIRKTIAQTEKAAQTLQEEKQETSHEVTDTISPAIINKLLKGFVVACIGIAALMAGFLIILLVLVIKTRK